MEDSTVRKISVSSLSSDDSTRNLIETLGGSKATGTRTANPKENQQPGTPVSLTSNESLGHLGASPTSIPKKKPIKFTVRKVSHETHSPELGDGKINNASSSPTSYGNGSLNAQKNILQSQEKYDLYDKKINKISKEITFLQNLLPPYNVEVDYATRTKIYSAIEKLKNKQDELEKKKYALGITISRLRRARDDSDFWVRAKGST